MSATSAAPIVHAEPARCAIGLGRALALVVAQCLFVVVLGQMVLGPRFLPDPERPLAPSLPLFVFVGASAAFGTVGLVWWCSLRVAGRSWRALGWHADCLTRQIGLGVLGAAVAIALMVALLGAVGVTPEYVLTSVRETTAAERATFVVLGAQAAFVEESLFRGNLLPALARRMPTWRAVLVSALVFAVYHLSPSPLSLLGKTALGLVCATLFVLTRGGLLAPAVAHALTWIVMGAL